MSYSHHVNKKICILHTLDIIAVGVLHFRLKYEPVRLNRIDAVTAWYWLVSNPNYFKALS